MIRFVKIGLISITFAGLFLFPANITNGQTNVNDFVFSEDLPTGQAHFEEGDDRIGSYFTRIYYFAMTAAVFLAVLMLVIAGIQYTASGVSVSAKENAKKRIWLAISGLILIFASWLLLRTINPDLVSTNLTLPTNRDVPFRGGGGGTTSRTTGGWQSIVVNSTLWDLSNEFDTKAECQEANPDRPLCSQNAFVVLDDVIRSRLNRGNAVGVKSNQCQRVNQSGCTSVALLPEVAINRLLLLNEDCDNTMGSCDIFITGGTEGGHATHGPRIAVVDLRENTQLNAFLLNERGTITSGGWSSPEAPPDVNSPKDCTEVQYGGALYRFETPGSPCAPNSSGDHWHVIF